MKIGIVMLAAVASALLVGCKSMPQTGKYFGPQSKMGKPELSVHSDGTVTERRGPFISSGTWTPVSDTMIKAELQGLEKHSSTRYYLLDKKNKTFRWGYSIEDVKVQE